MDTVTAQEFCKGNGYRIVYGYDMQMADYWVAVEVDGGKKVHHFETAEKQLAFCRWREYELSTRKPSAIAAMRAELDALKADAEVRGLHGRITERQGYAIRRAIPETQITLRVIEAVTNCKLDDVSKATASGLVELARRADWTRRCNAIMAELGR